MRNRGRERGEEMEQELLKCNYISERDKSVNEKKAMLCSKLQGHSGAILGIALHIWCLGVPLCDNVLLWNTSRIKIRSRRSTMLRNKMQQQHVSNLKGEHSTLNVQCAVTTLQNSPAQGKPSLHALSLWHRWVMVVWKCRGKNRTAWGWKGKWSECYVRIIFKIQVCFSV